MRNDVARHIHWNGKLKEITMTKFKTKSVGAVLIAVMAVSAPVTAFAATSHKNKKAQVIEGSGTHEIKKKVTEDTRSKTAKDARKKETGKKASGKDNFAKTSKKTVTKSKTKHGS